MTEADAESGNRVFQPGEHVGNCDNCGVVEEDDIELGTAAGERVCGHCGDPLRRVTVLDEPVEVDADVLA